MRCDASHTHPVCRPDVCRHELLALCGRIDARATAERTERERAGAVTVIWPDDARWVAPAGELVAA